MASPEGPAPETQREGEPPVPAPGEACCIRCGHPVVDRPAGCKGPCPTCGFLYPRGDCTD